MERRNDYNLQASNNRNFLRRSRSEMNFATSDTECTFDSRRRSWQPSPNSQRNILQEIDNQDLRNYPRSRNQADGQRSYLSETDDIEFTRPFDWEARRGHGNKDVDSSSWKSNLTRCNDNQENKMRFEKNAIETNSGLSNYSRSRTQDAFKNSMPTCPPTNTFRPSSMTNVNVPAATGHSQFVSPLLKNGLVFP